MHNDLWLCMVTHQAFLVSMSWLCDLSPRPPQSSYRRFSFHRRACKQLQQNQTEDANVKPLPHSEESPSTGRTYLNSIRSQQQRQHSRILPTSRLSSLATRPSLFALRLERFFARGKVWCLQHREPARGLEWVWHWSLVPDSRLVSNLPAGKETPVPKGK